MTARNERMGTSGRATVTLSRASVDEPLTNGLHPTLATPSRRSLAPGPLLALLRVADVVAAEVNLGQTLRRLVDSARELLGVPYAAIGLSGHDGVLEEFVQAGIDTQTLNKLGPGAALIEWLNERPDCWARAVTLRAGRIVILYVAENGAAVLTPHVERLAAGFAEAASAAIDNARLYQQARPDREQSRLHDDRARIAAELHDHVVRQLFAVGMGLEGIIESLDDAELRGRVVSYVTALDDSIRAIRETIYRVCDE